MPPIYNHILNELQGAVRLSIRGAAYELTEYHNVPQPEADIIALTVVMYAVDAIGDLPTLTLGEVINAIRASVEHEHANALAGAEESKISRMTDTTIDGHVGYLMTVAEFKKDCDQGMFIDYDGHGDLVKNGKIVTKRNQDNYPQWISPSTRHTISEDVTHILWYNK